jgi:hypothetical protein
VLDNFNFYESIELGDGPKKLDSVISSESAKIIRSWFKPMATPATVVIEFSNRFGKKRPRRKAFGWDLSKIHHGR